MCDTSSSQVKIIFSFFSVFFAIDLKTLLMMERGRIPNRERRKQWTRKMNCVSDRNFLLFSPCINKQFTSRHNSVDKNIIYIPACHGNKYLTVQVISLIFKTFLEDILLSCLLSYK